MRNGGNVSEYSVPSTYTPSDCDNVVTCTVHVIVPRPSEGVSSFNHYPKATTSTKTDTRSSSTSITITSCLDGNCPASVSTGIISVITRTVDNHLSLYTSVCLWISTSGSGSNLGSGSNARS